MKHRSIFTPKLIPIALAFLQLTILLLQLAYGQQAATTKAKPLPKPKTTSAQSFVCPDPEAKKACDSYSELKRAKDASLEDSLGDIGYICFRKNIDEFFIISFSKPTFVKQHYDEELKRIVKNDYATTRGNGGAVVIVNGIPDDAAVPQFVFRGEWSYFTLDASSTFYSDIIYPKIEDESQIRIIRIDDSQFHTIFDYRNTQKEPIHYNLTIQRSTGRFSESFLKDDETIPFISRVGRCLAQNK